MTPPIALSFIADDPFVGQEVAMDATDTLRDVGYTVRPADAGHMNTGQYLLDLGQRILDNKEFYALLLTTVKTITDTLTKRRQATAPAPTTRVEVVIIQGDREMPISAQDDEAFLRSLVLDVQRSIEIQTRIRE